MNKCLLSRPGLIAGPLHSTPLQIISQSLPRLDPIDSKSSLKYFLSIINHTFTNFLIQVLLVTGGYGSRYLDFDINTPLLDSTEVYYPSVGSWVIAGAKLPRPMISLKAIYIDDRVLIFGSLRLFYTLSLVS